DVYAIGTMLYEALTGDVPFDAESALTLFKKIDREPVVLPLDPEKGIDAQIRAIALRCLEKKREDRYARANLLAEDLERYLEGKAPKARPSGPVARVIAAARERPRAAASLVALLVVAPSVTAFVARVAMVRSLEKRTALARAAVDRRAGDARKQV